MATPKTTVDFFADIAATHVTTKKAKLMEALPSAIFVVPAPLSQDNSAPTAVPPRMNSAPEPKEVLSDLRQKYTPFLKGPCSCPFLSRGDHPTQEIYFGWK